MDFGTPSRAAPMVGMSLVSRSDVMTPRDAVPSDLSPEKTVQSAEAGDPVRVDIGASQRDAQARRNAEQSNVAKDGVLRQADRSRDDVVERRTVIDPQTRAIVVQKRNTETGETVSQLPDETLLKLRAYSRELAERARESEDDDHPRVERTA